MSAELRALAAVVHRVSGVVVPEGQLPSLGAALARVGAQLAPIDLLRDPDPTRLERLVDEVSIKETFFLRHPEELANADWPALAARAADAGRALRIWSVGCSSGEEAYTLALLAIEALGSERLPIDVLGSDLSLSALALADQGRYGARSMRLVSDAQRERWFTPGREWRVGSELRSYVRFARHNMVADAYPPLGEAPFDLVVCRNVLIYFDAETVARVVASLGQAVVPGGQLLLGTVDRLGSRAPGAARSAFTPAAATPPKPKIRPRTPTRARRSGTVRSPRASAAPPSAADAAAQAASAEAPTRRSLPAAPAPGTRTDHAAPAPAPETRSAQAAPATGEDAADAAFEAGSRALGAGDGAAAVTALRRALYLDPHRAVVALQLARAHEALGQVDAARGAYRRALRLVDAAADPAARAYDRVAAADVAAACRARLAVLDEEAAAAPTRLIES